MGTPRRSKEQWRELVAEFEVSGLSQQAYARRRRVKLGTFRSWLYSFRKEQASPRFVEVVSASRADARPRPSVALVVGSVRIEFEENPPVDYLLELARGVDGGTP